MTPYRKFSDLLKDGGLTVEPAKAANLAKAEPTSAGKVESLATLATLAAPRRYQRMSREAMPTPPGTALEPVGRWMFLIQRWGGSINEGAAVVHRVCAAAGALGTPRRDRAGDLFAKMEQRHRWAGRRKIEWLEIIADRMSADSMYWPSSRPDKTAAGQVGPEMILRALARASSHQLTKAKLERATGMTRNAISSLVLSMKKAGQIICVRPGVYGLPQAGTARHVPACEAIITALWAAPDHRATATELAAATCLTRNAIDSSANRMVGRGKKAGLLTRPKRGVFALSADALGKIDRREPIRIGHSVFVLDLAPAPVTGPRTLRIVR